MGLLQNQYPALAGWGSATET